MGDAAGAGPVLAEALSLAREIDALPIVAEALMAEGDRLRDSGQAAQASAQYREAARIAAEAQDAWLGLRARQKVAEAGGAGRDLAATVTEAQSAGLAPLVGRGRLALARLAMAGGKREEAIREAGEAVKAAAPIRQRDVLFQAHHVAALALSAIGRGVEARDAFLQALVPLTEMRAGLKDMPLKIFMSRPATASFLKDAGSALPEEAAIRAISAETL